MEKKSKISTYRLVVIGAMAAVTCILGPLSIQIPTSPVPISFTNLAVYLSIYVLGWKAGTFSYLIYLLLGLAGLPVFSGFTSGPAKLAGPTGGYLIGFIFMAAVGGWFIEKFDKKMWMHVLGLTLGTVIAYLFGTLWLSHILNCGFLAGLTSGVIPYLPGDAAKIALSAAVGPMLRRRLKRAGVLQEL